MQINYEKETAALISHLKRDGHHMGTIAVHQRCYNALQEHLIMYEVPFSMGAALKWLEHLKPHWAYSTYKRYRNALYRLEKYLLSGSIARGYCRSPADFVCQRRLTEKNESLLQEFRVAMNAKCRESMAKRYAVKCHDFLVFQTEQGLVSLSELSIEHIDEYWQHVYKMQISDSNKRTYVTAVVNLLAYLAQRGDIPKCYSNILPRDSADSLLTSLKFGVTGTAFQPSKEIEPLAAEFLSNLDKQRYSISSKQVYGNDFTNFFLFIEVNHLEYSSESVELWLKHSPKNASWERRRHTLTLFADYLSTGSTYKASYYTWQPLQFDNLPDWSRNIIIGFITERQREGLAKTTLTKCRAAGYRFFRFLDLKGIRCANEITPELVKLFHNTDKHTNPRSKNAYGITTRQLLSYMAEQKLVPQTLFLAISTQCASRQNIVNIMSTEMESAVYDYRKNASSPFELRNTAIVMLGLRMGVRASDIVKLQIDDIDWQKCTVSFVQRKTRKVITLPIPIDVGNSVYKYVMEGRPQSGVNGDRYIFIRHNAPFSGLMSIRACENALKNILSAYGLKLPAGQGFHITRKTFATRLLTSQNSIDDISNALGHTQTETTERYLAHDEDGMRLCPLPFESVGAL